MSGLMLNMRRGDDDDGSLGDPLDDGGGALLSA
jgi:hypothetical protein